VTTPSRSRLQEIAADREVRLRRKDSEQRSANANRFARAVNLTIVLIGICLGLELPAFGDETMAMNPGTSSGWATGVGISNGGADGWNETREFVIQLNGRTWPFRLRMSLVGLGVIFSLTGLLALAVFLGLVAQRRASDVSKIAGRYRLLFEDSPLPMAVFDLESALLFGCQPGCRSVVRLHSGRVFSNDPPGDSAYWGRSPAHGGPQHSRALGGLQNDIREPTQRRTIADD
jgi:hypothetical protein